MQLSSNLKVKESPLHGKGLYATEIIRNGKIVVSWNPKILSKKEADQLPKVEQEHYLYPEGEQFLWMQPPEKYINHSCDANTMVVGRSDVAVRDIQPGEEITSDYIDVNTEYFECNCGSSKCRGKSRA